MIENKYCRALAELRSKPAHELKEVGDQWRTPDLLFWGINSIFGPMVLDLFADDSNAKCPACYTAEDNALTQDWSERLAELGGAAFANPPYSRSQYHEKQAITGMTHIMNHTMAMRDKGGRYIPVEPFLSVYRESDIVPSLPANEILRKKVQKIFLIKVDPESPESFMHRPKRRRWQNEMYTRWVKSQQCSCCNNTADDAHHLIGYGQGGMGTKAHDLFVIPLCRAHHCELHADPMKFEAKYGDQLTLLFRFLDRALAIGVLE